MATRVYEFISGVETPSPPTASDPTNTTDLVPFLYAEGRYQRELTLAQLKAITATYRANHDVAHVNGSGYRHEFYFDSASAATGNDATVITPNAGTGRWLIVPELFDAEFANNFRVGVSTSSNTLLIELFGANGSALSVTNMARFGLRNQTSDTQPNYNDYYLFAPLTTLTVPNGGTLGLSANVDSILYAVLINTNNTVAGLELGVCGFRPTPGWRYDVVAVGTGSDDFSTIYGQTTGSNRQVAVIGAFRISEGTPGVWATGPTKVWNSPVHGFIGIGDYLEGHVTSTASTVDADTYVDVAGTTLTLQPGIWELGYDVAMGLLRTTGAPQGEAVIATAANVVVEGTRGFAADFDTVVDKIFNMSRQTRLHITTATTYKMRVRNVAASATSQAFVFNSGSLSGSLSGDDNSSIIWARKVG